ncbi:MAG: LysR family transcriptional regulator [Rubripirellula sp.]
MHLRTLELFCTIAEQRSFSKAAAVHQLTQSAVSQAIQHLEESVGVELIDRSKRPLVLTPAGKTYLGGLRGILRSYERLEQEVRSTSRQLSGQVTIGTIVSVGLSYMPEASEAFARLHPEVDVRTDFGSNDRVFEMTSEGEVDFGLVSFPKNTKDLQFVPWQQEPMRLVCSSEHQLATQHEVTLSQLRGIEMVGFDPGLQLRQEIDQCLSKAGISVKVRMEFDNADSMIRAIQASRGIGIVPEAAVRRETANGSLRVVACRELRMTRPLGIIFRRSGRLSRAASEFGSLLLGRPLESGKRSKSGSGKLAVEAATIEAGTGTSIVA